MSLTRPLQAASTTLRRCVCQQQRLASTSTAVSTSTSSSSASKKPGLIARVRARAERAAVNVRPPTARMEREMERMNLEEGGGSIFERREQGQREVEQETATTTSTGRTGMTAIPGQRAWTEHKTSTGNITHSPRKLNDIARLIARKPIDSAILQMQMSDKRVAKSRIKSMLVLARDHAVMKGLSREELVVKEAWVSKGVFLKRLDIKGRGRHGIKMRPESRMHVVLAPGPSRAALKQQEFDKRVKQRLQTGGAGYALREDRKIVNLPRLQGSGAGYAW